MSSRKDAALKNQRKRVPKAQQQLTDRQFELQRSTLIEIYRSNAMRTLKDVRCGLVNEVDLDKLQNFVQTSLALMSLVSVSTFRQAQRNAELLGFFKGYGDHGCYEVVLDPRKQKNVELELDMDSVIEQAQQEMEQ